MEDPARKRRRVLPQTAVPVDQDEVSGAPEPRRKRPSFASPTKSSMARFNPTILDRRRSASPAKPEGSQARRGSDAGSDRSLSELLTPQPGVAVEDVAPASEPDRREHEMGESNEGLDRASRAPRAGPVAKPNPRPLPPPAPDGEDELNPFLGHTLRRSPVTGVSIPAPPEPELPPSVPDPLLSTPPRGIHSSPSRWKGKSKAKKTSPLKAPAEPTEAGPSDQAGAEASKKPGSGPSNTPGAEPNNKSGEEHSREFGEELSKKSGEEPSKQLRAEPSKKPGTEAKTSSVGESKKKSGSEPGKKSGAQPSKKSGVEATKKTRAEPSKKSGAEPSKKSGSEHSKKPSGSPPGSLREAELSCDFALDPTTNKARLVAAHDPDENKLKERDELRAEIAKLKSDLKLAGAENERLRLMQASGRTVASNDEDAVIDLLRRQFLSADEMPQPTSSQQLTQAILNPMGLLPFGRPSLATQPTTDDGVDLDQIKSHHPVPMSADEELPYLQLFSPFSVESSVVVLPTKPGRPLRQRRMVTLRSRDSPGLFTAKVEMTVHAMNLSITDLAVTSLEPSARFELQPFLDKICSGDCNRTMQRNVGILSWAMAEWYRVAMRRALFWLRLERNLGSPDKVMRSAAHLWEGRRRQQQQPEDEVETERNVKTEEDTCTTADLMRYLGQHALDIRVPTGKGSDGDECFLRLEWRIDFDWTGEAQSRVTTLVGVPGKWREADGRGILGKVPKLFEDLVAGGQDAEEAVGIMTALLVGTQGSGDDAT
ncbi:hypothetical protein XA68_15661 [Ophiocordyceps unilateralis]|uniref:Uncharacterized protein n=1 Tax=Ophiocordyceps unilateralis TaxID=268505 RepID=A0A2A9P654_OPHUN|nr:hypothetical protein XA68_15661 [Ophiocordyceps unilateralis]